MPLLACFSTMYYTYRPEIPASQSPNSHIVAKSSERSLEILVAPILAQRLFQVRSHVELLLSIMTDNEMENLTARANDRGRNRQFSKSHQDE